MKKAFLLIGLFVSLFAFSAGAAYAQETPAPQDLPVDPLLEADAKANFEVAQTYFRTRKAYKAVLMRFEETFAAYPTYSKMDEFLYMAGMSSYYLSQNKGKQKLNTLADNDEERKKYTPEKLREDSAMYLSMLVEKYPNSKYKNDAQKTLKELKK
ncbi:MAG TPA: outer membrane protein assembly factor BamD [Pyrinomonadaceae bacterium]